MTDSRGEGSSVARVGARWQRAGGAFFPGLAAVLATYAPLLWSLAAHPASVGPLDWDLAAGVVECFRKIVREHGQFPWWNPWSAGGFPYFGNPLCPSPLSLPAALSLVIGTLPALKLSVIAFAIFGYFGMVRLAARATGEPLFQAMAGVLFACNGGLALHLGVGHLFLDYFFYPWIIALLLDVNDRLNARSAIGAGLFLAMAVHNVIHYGFVYMVLTAAGLFLYGLCRQPRRVALIGGYCLFGFSFLAAAGLRLYLALTVMHDYPRKERIDIAFNALRIVRLFLQPGQTQAMPAADNLGWWEWGCYLGLLAFALFTYSAIKRPSIVHFVFAAGVVLFLSSARYTPYYLLNEYVPVFQSMRVAPRIRIWLVPAFAAGVIAGLELIRRRRLAHLLAILVMADVTANAYYSLHASLGGETVKSTEALPPNDKPYPVIYRDHGYDMSVYRGVLHGYSHTPGYEPAISGLLYNLAKQPLAAVNEPGYPGAFHTQTGATEPAYYSPNRIVFEGIKGPLRLNINPGSYWTVNGKHVFANYRVSEIEQPFIAEPDSNGRIVLAIAPKGLRAGILISLGAAALAGVLYFGLRRA